MEKAKRSTKRKRRNKYRMRLDLLDAVGQVLKKEGFINLTLNNVCKYADADRNAIYRHFGDFDGLLSQYIEKKDYWLEALRQVKDIEIQDFKMFLKQMLFNQYDSIDSDQELQQLLIWELCELSLRTKTIAEQREMLSEKLINQFETHFEPAGIDFNSISATIIAGIYYLILHKRHSTFCQVDFTKEKQRALAAIEQIVEMLFAYRAQETYKTDTAKKALSKGLAPSLVAEITGLDADQINKLT